MNPTTKDYDRLWERLQQLPEETLITEVNDEVKTLDYGEELYVIGQALVLIGRELNGIRVRMQ